METAAKRGGRPGRRRLAALCVGAALLLASCQTMEKVLPYAVVAGGAILSVVALNFVGDCSGGDTWYTSCDANGEVTTGYQEQVLLMISTFTAVGGAAADAWVEHREKQRELAKLETAETKVDTEYAKLQSSQPPGANAWATAYGTPSAGPAEPARWGSAAPPPGGGYASAYAPGPGAAPGYGGPPPGYGGPPPGYGGAPPGYAAPPGYGAPPAGAPPPAADPAAAAPGGNPWGDRYGEGSSQPRATGPLALDVALLKRAAGADGSERMVAFPDGEVLFDGRGEAIEDHFRVFASPSEDSYLYVIAIDAVGRVQPLYPRRYPDQSNPVHAGERILLPDDKTWYGLDEFTGLQHIYVYASPEPRIDLEKQLTLFASAPPPVPRGVVHTVSEPTVLNSQGLQSRGLTGVVPGDVVRMPGDAALEFQPTRVLASGSDRDVVATRVFDHR